MRIEAFDKVYTPQLSQYLRGCGGQDPGTLAAQIRQPVVKFVYYFYSQSVLICSGIKALFYDSTEERFPVQFVKL
jgi:hypothetical protein